MLDIFDLMFAIVFWGAIFLFIVMSILYVIKPKCSHDKQDKYDNDGFLGDKHCQNNDKIHHAKFSNLNCNIHH